MNFNWKQWAIILVVFAVGFSGGFYVKTLSENKKLSSMEYVNVVLQNSQGYPNHSGDFPVLKSDVPGFVFNPPIALIEMDTDSSVKDIFVNGIIYEDGAIIKIPNGMFGSEKEFRNWLDEYGIMIHENFAHEEFNN